MRLSIVESLDCASVGNSSIIEVGDTKELSPRSRVFALQREYPVFYDEEGSFEAFPSFYYAPLPEANFYENIHSEFININPIIKTGDINVTGVGASSIIQVGSTSYIDMESRIKHVRHFINPPESE